MMKKKKSNSGGSSILVVMMIVTAVLGVGWMIAPDGVKHEIKEIKKTVKKLLSDDENKDPFLSVKVEPSDKLTIDSMRAIWEWQRQYASQRKSFVNSISDLGLGVGRGMNGYVRQIDIWNARYDTNTELAADFRRSDGKRYYYRLFPMSDANSKFASVIAAIPDGDHEAFVTLAGPVDLKNPFSYNHPWPVYKFKNAKDLTEALKTNLTMSASSIISMLPKNSISVTNYLSFEGLYPKEFYPGNAK